MATPIWKFVIWERVNKSGKWCPYSAEVSQLLELSYKKELDVASLGDADESLKIYTVNLNDMVQISQVTGTKSTVRRCLCDTLNDFCKGYTWQWCDNHSSWHSYDIDVNNFIEKAFLEKKKHVTLNKTFRGYQYEIDFMKMSQINKQSKRRRSIRRQQQASPYPVVDISNVQEQNQAVSSNTDILTNVDPVVEYPDLLKEIPGSSSLEAQADSYMRNVQTVIVPPLNQGSAGVQTNAELCDQNQNIPDSPILKPNLNTPALTATVNGFPWDASRPPYTPDSKLKPVPGLSPLPKTPKAKKRKKKTKKGKHVIPEENAESEDILKEFTDIINVNQASEENQDCIICCESLNSGSSYDGDFTVLKLKLCSHMFHKSCLLAMYKSGPKDKSLQCPTCKKIHGEKCGIQPPGEMIYHVLPYSLPGYTEHETIRIIYNIPSGTQGPEHPNPGKKYTSRGFPRHCFLPDNDMGRKILRLLIKAWKRRLIFTIGRSSTTGEENTVTWNEIHHKTEFGCNRRGHGYPDPNYFENVLAELEAHGVKDDEVFLWYPAH